ncbi:arylesterase [Kushneria sinocarnis]
MQPLAQSDPLQPVPGGRGVERSEGWVSLLRERLGDAHQVVNASTSGDTTAGGLSRLPEALERTRPDIVLLELGGNDGLRGLSLEQMKSNLAQMIEQSRAAGARVGLLGIRIPPNYGQAYTEAFRAIYPELAQRYEIPLVPFLLEGVALNDELMQSDGIHPNAEGQPIILDNVWPVLQGLLQTPDSATAQRAGS